MTTDTPAATATVSASPPTYTFNDLEIGFTSTFQFHANTSGCGPQQVGFWRPVPAAGFYALGDLISPGYGDANQTMFAATVKATHTGATGTGARPPLAAPTGYQATGFLQMNSPTEPAPGASSVAGSWPGVPAGADLSSGIALTFWRPIPPDDYVSLGVVIGGATFGDNTVLGSLTPPPTDLVMCVRSDLVAPAPINPQCYFSGGIVGSPINMWKTLPPQPQPGLLYFNPGTFFVNRYDIGVAVTPPPSDPTAYSLILNLAEQSQQQQRTPSAPVLAGAWRPAGPTESVSYRVTLPWFAVTDPTMSGFEQFTKSPNYHLDRIDTYTCVGFGSNLTTVPQQQSVQWTTGTSGEQSKTFSETTSIEIDAGTSTDFFTAKLTQSFTYTTTTTSGWSQSQSVSEQTTIPPNAAVAVFVINSTYNLLRSDGSLVTGGVPYTADNSTMCWAQYPPVAPAGSRPPG